MLLRETQHYNNEVSAVKEDSKGRADWIIMGRNNNRQSGGRRSNTSNGQRKANTSDSANKTTPSRTKESLKDCVCDTQTAKQANEFKLNAEFIIAHIRGKHTWGEDISNSLEMMDYIMLVEPTRDRSAAQIEADRKFEQETFDMEHKSKSELHNKRKLALATNKAKAFSLILTQCSDRLKARIEARSDYETMKKDPIKLLKAMQELMEDRL